MPAAKDDSSTTIETEVKAFAKDITDAAAKLLKARAEKAAAGAKPADKTAKPGKKDDTPKEITFSLSQNASSKSRTPAEQAKEVAAGRSWVCWGAHMADKARHVLMKVDGKVSFEPKKAFGPDFDTFKKEWGVAMKSNNLKNARGTDGWFDGDEFHLELPDSKIDKTDERVKACLAEYVRLTHTEGGKPNEKFEKSYAKLLKPYIDDAAKKKK